MLSLALSLLLSPARAGEPQDILLSGLDSYQGEVYGNREGIAEAWKTVAVGLGTGIANKAQGGATLGLDGFDLSVGATTVFVQGSRFDGAPTAWERARSGNPSAGALFIPELHLRKGLPLSLEAGVRGGFISATRQGVFGGYGRFAPIEGYRKAPELALQLGYTGYIGNDELDLGVGDASLSIGKTWAFATRQRARTRTVHPHLGVGMNWIRAVPLLDEERQEELGIASLRAKKSAEDFDPAMRPIVVQGGLRLVSGSVALHLCAAVPLNARPSMESRLGLIF